MPGRGLIVDDDPQVIQRRATSVRCCNCAMERTMDRLRPFQATAHEDGFVELNESRDGTVLWLKKTSRDESREIHERMCIDSVTNSATVFWVSSAGGLNSKTFRNDVSMQEWFKVRSQGLVETRHNPTPILLETRRP
jgi:hypothetical protein